MTTPTPLPPFLRNLRMQLRSLTRPTVFGSLIFVIAVSVMAGNFLKNASNESASEEVAPNASANPELAEAIADEDDLANAAEIDSSTELLDALSRLADDEEKQQQEAMPPEQKEQSLFEALLSREKGALSLDPNAKTGGKQDGKQDEDKETSGSLFSIPLLGQPTTTELPSVDVSAEPLANPTVNLPGVNLSYRAIGGVNLFANPTTEANPVPLSPLQTALQEAATAAAPNPFLGISPTQSLRGQRFNPVQPDLNQPSLLAPLTVGQSAVLQRNGGTRSSLYGQPVSPFSQGTPSGAIANPYTTLPTAPTGQAIAPTVAPTPTNAFGAPLNSYNYLTGSPATYSPTAPTTNRVVPQPTRPVLAAPTTPTTVNPIQSGNPASNTLTPATNPSLQPQPLQTPQSPATVPRSTPGRYIGGGEINTFSNP